jgi:rhomboid family protein
MRMNNGGRMAFTGFQLTPVVKGLLIANVAVFVLQQLLPNVLEQWGAFNSRLAINQFQVWRFVTYMFLHGSMSHILFNMLGVWIFGTQIEALWGQRTFLFFYFICGLGGSFLYGIFGFLGFGGGWMLGASGAVMGLLLAYGMSFPNNLVFLMGFIPIKAKYLVVLYGLMDLLSIPNNDGVANLAHLGGLLAGFIFIQITIPGLSGQMFKDSLLSSKWKAARARQRMKIVRPEKPSAKKTESKGFRPGPTAGVDQKQIDSILDKISRDGLQSLTDEEQDLLRRAGRK